MVYLNIDDMKLLTKIITYLDMEKIRYTFNKCENITFAIVARLDKKSIDIIENYRTIFIAYNIEYLFSKQEYINEISKNLNKCYKVIVSMEYLKKIVKNNIKTDIVVIHKEIPLIKYNKRDTRILKKKYIVVNDFKLKNLKLFQELTNKFDYKYYYIGFNKLKVEDENIYNKLPNSVKKIKYFDYDIYKDIVKNSYIVIDLNEDVDIKYIQIPILFKKNLIVKDIPYYDKYLVSNKDIYMFNTKKDLFLKLKKIIDGRLSDLTDDAFYKINDDNCKVIAHKYSQILK